MRPFKKLFPFANWLMRFAVLLFVILTFWKTFTLFNFQSITFYVAAIYIIFSALLFIGGFLFKGSLTVFSSLMLILVTLYFAFVNLGPKLDQHLAVYIVMVSVFIYFFTTGNKR